MTLRLKHTANSMLPTSAGRFLVRLAKEIFLAYPEEIEFPLKVPEELDVKAGLFVAVVEILEQGQRKTLSCTGYPFPEVSIVQAVVDAAVSSVIRAKVFHQSELASPHGKAVRVIVVTEPQRVYMERRVDYPKAIVAERDGVMVRRGFNMAVLLPQVALERGLDGLDLLSECCAKAGLPPDAWLLRGTEISIFKTRVFEEEI